LYYSDANPFHLGRFASVLLNQARAPPGRTRAQGEGEINGWKDDAPHRIFGLAAHDAEMICILAIVGIAAAIWTTAAAAQGYYRWGVFRERSFLGIPVDQRRCRVQEIGPGEILPEELLARASTFAEAISTYRFLVSRGFCAPWRIAPPVLVAVTLPRAG
jgi:hypothetical protein